MYAREEDVFNAVYHQLKNFVSEHFIMDAQYKQQVQKFNNQIAELTQDSEKAWTSAMEQYEQYVQGETSKEALRMALDTAHNAKSVLATVSEQKAAYDKKYRFVADLQNSIKMKIRELKSADYNRNESAILQKANSIVKRFSADPYFQHICQDKYVAYLTKPGVTKAKECLKESSVLGVLSAYKLFYVGCSRARRNLTILLDRSKLQGDLQKQKKMFKELGFSVEEIMV